MAFASTLILQPVSSSEAVNSPQRRRERQAGCRSFGTELLRALGVFAVTAVIIDKHDASATLPAEII
jgi:hypothetical protein